MEIWLGVKQAQESRVLKTREPLQWDVGKDACSEPQRRDMATKVLLELGNGAGFPMSTCRWTQNLNSDRESPQSCRDKPWVSWEAPWLPSPPHPHPCPQSTAQTNPGFPGKPPVCHPHAHLHPQEQLKAAASPSKPSLHRPGSCCSVALGHHCWKQNLLGQSEAEENPGLPG